MDIYAITSQKGGVGKTTTTVNLGAALAHEGRRVLLLDMDPQGSLTTAVGSKAEGLSMEDVLRQPESLREAISPCAGKMQVVPAAPTLVSVFQELYAMPQPAFRLASALQTVQDRFDYTLIDCPPSLGHATTNALTASRVALVPLQCEFLSLRGLRDVEDIVAMIRETTNPALQLRVLGTMFDQRTLHAKEVLEEAHTSLPGLVFETVIPRTVRLAEAPALGQTILEYAPESTGAYAYSRLAQEISQEEAKHGASGRPSDGVGQFAAYRQAA